MYPLMYSLPNEVKGSLPQSISSSLNSRSHQPEHVVVQVACRDTAVVMVQPSLHGHMTRVNRVEMPTPAAKFTSADANPFPVNVQAPACHFVAGMSIGDTHAIFGQPFRHCRSDVRPRRRREGFHISRPAARCCRQDGPLVRHQTLGVRDFLLARAEGDALLRNDLPCNSPENSSRPSPRCL